MKFYVHGEDPDLTIIVVWEKDKAGTIQDVLGVFCESLKQKYPQIEEKKTDTQYYVVKNSRGKVLPHATDVCSVVKQMDDIHVIWSTVALFSTASGGVDSTLPDSRENKAASGATEQSRALFSKASGGVDSTLPDALENKAASGATEQSRALFSRASGGVDSTPSDALENKAASRATEQSRALFSRASGGVDSTPPDVLEKKAASRAKEQASAESDDKKNSEQIKLLEGRNNAALIHVNNARYRKAIQIYTGMLAVDSKSKLALSGLAVCYFKAGRAKQALQYASKGLKYHPNDPEFLLLVGKCSVAMGDGDKAIEHLMKLCKLIRQNKGTDTAEKNDIQVLLAKAYLVKDQRDMAITILQGVLRENLEHPDALVEYAALLYPLGPAQREEALTALLSVLARNQTDKRAKQVFATVCRQPGGLDVLRNVAGAVLNDVPALVYLAMCLKDCSAIQESLALLEMAYKLDKSNPSTALIYVHALELLDNYKDMLAFYRQYFQDCPDWGICQLTCSFVHSYLSQVISDDLTVLLDGLETQKMVVCSACQTFEVPSRPYTEDELYFIALLCTLIKILYIKGLLPVIPPLLDMVKCFSEGKDLHLTNIRNEVAFYSCIQEVFSTYSEIPATVQPGQEGVVYMVGDSHCIPTAWQSIYIKDERCTIYPVLSTGTKIWHLREESDFYPKVNFHSVIRAIPDGATVIFCLGEIDCREAFLKCWEKARYDKIEDAMVMVTQIYLKLLKSLRHAHNWRIFVHPVLPVLDITRPIVMQFNRILATQLLTDPTLSWLNFVNELLSADEQTFKEEYKLDGTHIHPRYVELMSQALSECI